MRYLLLNLMTILLFTACKTSQKAAGNDGSSGIPKTENSLLWEISGKTLQQSSYLYGTIHMIGKEDFFLTEATKEAFAKTDKVTFEINMEDMTDMSKMMPLMMKAFMAGDTTLKDLLTTEEYSQVADYFEKMGLPMMFLDRIKPMFLSALTSGGDVDLMGGGGNTDIKSYEIELMEMAKKENKAIDGLETAEYQMSMFDSIPYKVQAKMLVESLNAVDSGEDELAKLVKLYKDQNLEGMQQLMKDDEQGIGKYEDLLLIGRNKNWIPIMGQMMLKQSTFFAVGAGHLGGEQGVVALLRQAGYKVVPLK